MTKKEYQKLNDLLLKRKELLEKHLEENKYRETPSVAYGKREEIQAINIIMARTLYLAEL